MIYLTTINAPPVKKKMKNAFWENLIFTRFNLDIDHVLVNISANSIIVVKCMQSSSRWCQFQIIIKITKLSRMKVGRLPKPNLPPIRMVDSFYTDQCQSLVHPFIFLYSTSDHRSNLLVIKNSTINYRMFSICIGDGRDWQTSWMRWKHTYQTNTTHMRSSIFIRCRVHNIIVIKKLPFIIYINTCFHVMLRLII